MFLFWKTNPQQPELPEPPKEVLTPGDCECKHARCFHVDGVGGCKVSFPADEEWPRGAVCACQIYIKGKDDNGGDDSDPEPVPSADDLERLYRK